MSKLARQQIISTRIYFTLDSTSNLEIKNMRTITKFGLMFYKLNLCPVCTGVTNGSQRLYKIRIISPTRTVTRVTDHVSVILSSPYRAVNTLRLGYKDQSVNVV